MKLKVFTAISILLLATACNKGFDAKDHGSVYDANKMVYDKFPDEDHQADSSPLGEAFQNRESVSADFDVKLITNATWKMVGSFEHQSGAKTYIEGVTLGISQSLTNDAKEQSTIELRSSCVIATVKVNFAKTSLAGSQSSVTGVSLAGQASVNRSCTGSVDVAISAFLSQLPGVGSVDAPTALGVWGPYLYVGVGHAKTFVFVKP